MRIFLCGDTGRLNRGCEAIVRGSAEVLRRERADAELYLASFAPEQNRPMTREVGMTLLPYRGYPTKIHRYFCAATRRAFPKSLVGYGLIQKNLLDRIEAEDLCLNIGGDTYCYTRPAISLALNKHNHRRGVKTVLWCCSIEKDKIQGEIFRDLNRYRYIFAREQITVDNLKERGIPEEKIVKVCDPAFFLQKKEVPLPAGFQVGNTVGINLSDCVVYGKYHAAYSATKALIEWILKETDMSVCLVPHVYAISDEEHHDYPILKRLYEEFEDERVSLVNQEYDCEQLKYIISNCRFFMGARTHSTIAAYSSGIPTLVIGYSVKSKGIATDLFGTYENYVIPFETITSDDQILDAFRLLVDNEAEIRARYERILPDYKKQLTDAIRTYLLDETPWKAEMGICDRLQCTGCSACANVCPHGCITMTRDKEGFSYPVIDTARCVGCGKCRTTCPVANKLRDDNAVPAAYAAKNGNSATRKDSSSGGMFALLAEQVLASGGAVIGAAFDQNHRVVHTVAETAEELRALMGSKYVQSEIGDAYARAAQMLKAGRTVYFSGTPCQIAGLHAYLGKPYDNLITQDIVCHGVPSPTAWETYLAHRARRAGAHTVTAVQMRQKSEDGQTRMSLQFDGGKTYSEIAGNDPFMRSYLSNVNLRPACSDCSFKQLHRVADITLGDFWGVERVAPDMADPAGVSLTLIHSDKGAALLEQVRDRATLSPVPFEAAIAENAAYLRSSPDMPIRKRFFRRLHRKNFDKTVKKYCGSGKLAKIRRLVSKF